MSVDLGSLSNVAMILLWVGASSWSDCCRVFFSISRDPCILPESQLGLSSLSHGDCHLTCSSLCELLLRACIPLFEGTNYYMYTYGGATFSGGICVSCM